MPSAVPPLPAEDLRAAISIPPADQQFGAKVEHLTISKTQNLVDALMEQLQIPQDIIQELMRFGAVYYCNVVPLPSGKYGGTLPPDELARITDAHKLGVATWGRNPHHHQPQRVLLDREVTAGGYVRVHLQPKRFPAAYKVDWSTRVLHTGADFVVVNKPPGVQVPPTADNVLESVVAKVAEVLAMERDTLLTTHRLDAGTEGVLVLAKTPAFARYFQELLRDKQDSVRKLYRCLASGRPPLGRVVHWASIRQRSKGEPPHTVVHTEVPEGQQEGAGLRRCELIVRQVEEVELRGAARQQWGERAWEVTVELVTGRTHQIRAQLAALGCPLLGDALYTALLQAKQLEAARSVGASGTAAAGLHATTTATHSDEHRAATAGGPMEGSTAATAPGGAGGSSDIPQSCPAVTTSSTALAEASSGVAGRAPAASSSGGVPGGAATGQQCSGCSSSGAAVGTADALAPALAAGAAAGVGVAAASSSRSSEAAATSAAHRGDGAACGGGLASSEAGEPRERAGVPAAAAGEWQWQDELRQDPLRPIALQAFRLEVLEAGPMGASPPAVFEAGTPWWRSS